MFLGGPDRWSKPRGHAVVRIDSSTISRGQANIILDDNLENFISFDWISRTPTISRPFRLARVADAVQQATQRGTVQVENGLHDLACVCPGQWIGVTLCLL